MRAGAVRAVAHAETQVVAHGHVGEKGGILKDIAHRAAMRRQEDSGLAVLPDLAVQAAKAAGLALQPGDGAQPGGLAGAGGAENGGDAPGGEGGGHIQIKIAAA